jgi:hypothetical protein
VTIERLLEAVLRLAQAGGRPLNNVKAEIHDAYFGRPSTVGIGMQKVLHHRTSVLLALGATGGWSVIGEATIDLNNMVLEIKYDDKAPWWTVKPFIEAMEGK